jgi:ABC-type amino acid transport substrate-binding protein
MSLQLWRFLLAMLFAVALPASAIEVTPKAVIVGTVRQGFAPSQIARGILTEAYVSMGYRAEFVPFPPLRMISELELGRIDALIIAEAEFAQLHPTSIQVNVPIWTDEMVAFAKRPLAIGSWDDLTAHKVGFIKGMRIIEKRLAAGRRLEAVSGTEPLFLMLDAGRTDAVVTSRLIGQLMVRELGLTGVREVSPVLEIVPTYHFLARKNADLKAPLEAVLGQMLKSGRIAEITQSITADLLLQRKRSVRP